jgi:hypothetical protein
MLSRDDVLRRLPAITGLVVAIVVIVACGRSQSLRATGSANAQTGADTVRPVAMGELVRGSVAGDEPLICAHAREQSRFEGPCQRFRLHVPEAGLLRIRLTWDDVLPLRLELRTVEGTEVNAMCCRSPIDLTASIVAGGVYDIEVILLSDWGMSEGETFQMTASLQRSGIAKVSR